MSRAFIQKRLPFKPTDIGGCQLWLDASDSTTISLTGSTVTQINDKSGNSNNTSSSTGTVTYTAGGLNSRPAFSFNATGGFRGPISITGTTLTAFTVATLNSGVNYNGRLLGLANATQNDYAYATTGQPFFCRNGGPNVSGYRNNTYMSYQTNTFDTPFIGTSQFTGSSNITSVNGTPGTAVTDANGSFSITKYGFGCEGLSDAGVNWYGYCSEMILYNSLLSTAQRQQVESYLAQKWGLQTSLPQGHPGTRGIVYPASPLNVMFRVPYQTGFIPTSISSCQLWLDASDITTITLSGSSVTQWKDKSVTMASAIQNNSLGYPTYVSGSTPYVLFSPNQALRIASWNYSSSWTVILAMNSVTLAARWFISPYNNLGLVYMGMSEPGNKIFSGLLAGSGDVTGNHLESTMAQNTSTTGVFNYYRDAQIQSTNTTNAGIASVNGIALGIGANQSGDYDIGGTYQIYELLIFSSFLGDSDRFNVEGYLAWKWGMQANLPAGHPYKNAAPNVSNQFGISRPQNLPVPPITIYAGPRPPTLQTRTFTYSGADQDFTVPATISPAIITVYMWAAAGGSGYNGGGNTSISGAGAYLSGSFSVTPNSTLKIIVGQAGIGFYFWNQYGPTGGSTIYGGGGKAGTFCGTGGGRSAIQIISGTDYIVVGAGGGGGLYNSNGTGGYGDSVTGTGGDGGGGDQRGRGGTQVAGGVGGTGSGSVYPGSSQLGGGRIDTSAGAGGGGGYYGGGAGNISGYVGGGGGGGSSYVGNLTNVTTSNSSDGFTAPNTASIYYISGVAAGASPGNAAGNGLIVLTYYS